MSLEKVNALKQKGNDAFKVGNLPEAIDNYSKAIDLAGETDSSSKCILYSNRAQAMLIEKRYAEALADAEESLKFNSSFMKSVVRRANANIKLGNNEKAVKDLREILKQDPKNLAANNLMSEVSNPGQMNANFAGAYIGHYLHRDLSVNVADYIRAGLVVSRKLQRIMFLSAKGVPYLQKILNGSGVGVVPGLYRHSMFMLSQWFIAKFMKVIPRNLALPTILSDSMFKLILEVFHPTAYLVIGTNECVQRYGSLCKFATVCYEYESMIDVALANHNALQKIQSSSAILTRLPYFPEIVNFNEKAFPALDTLLVVKRFVVDMEFLKVWKQHKWGVRTLIFKDRWPNLMNFEHFGGQISNDVTKLYLPVVEASADLLCSNQLPHMKQALVTLKRVFPNLTEVVGRVEIMWPSSIFMQTISRVLKPYITYLAKEVNDSVKPEWCSKLKVLVIFSADCTLIGITQLDTNLLKRIVNECRREVDCLDHISLHGPSPNLFDWCEMICSPVLIKMSTKHADFEIAFKF